MIVETLDDWNQVLRGCGCCGMPDHADLELFGEYRAGLGSSRSDAIANISAWTESGDPFDSQYLAPGDPGNPGYQHYVYQARWKWRIPRTCAGSYFKVTWDIGKYPLGQNPFTDTAGITWTRIGHGDPDDQSTWESGWNTMDIPAFRGNFRVVNVRSVSWRSAKFGEKPRPLGSSWTLP